jgi:acetyl-CoA synthetase
VQGREIEGEGEGFIVVKQPWPGMMRTVYGNQDRFEHTYFAQFDGYYCTGDGMFMHGSMAWQAGAQKAAPV